MLNVVNLDRIGDGRVHHSAAGPARSRGFAGIAQRLIWWRQKNAI